MGGKSSKSASGSSSSSSKQQRKQEKQDAQAAQAAQRQKVKQQLQRTTSDSSSDASDSDADTIANKQLEREEVSFTVGASSITGKRPYNEDRYAVHTPFPLIEAHSHIKSWNLFGVYDGHGGSATAQYVAAKLPAHIQYCQAQLKKPHLPDAKERLFQIAYQQCDTEVLGLQRTRVPADRSGTTAVTVLIDHREIVSANVGDSRCILSRNNGQCIELTEDHKPITKSEKRRVEASGGRVTIPMLPQAWLNPQTHPKTSKALEAQRSGGYAELNDRGLAVSRAFGNIAFKSNSKLAADKQCIVCTPTTKRLERDPRDEFIVLATDGMTNVVDNEEAVAFVRERLVQNFTDRSYEFLKRKMRTMSRDFLGSEESDPRRLDDYASTEPEEDQRLVDEIAAELTQFAMDEKSNDNITVVIAVFDDFITRLKRTGIRRCVDEAEEEQAEIERRSIELASTPPDQDVVFHQREVAQKAEADVMSTPARKRAITAANARHANQSLSIDTSPEAIQQPQETEEIMIAPADDNSANIHPTAMGLTPATVNRLGRTIYTRGGQPPSASPQADFDPPSQVAVSERAVSSVTPTKRSEGT